MQTFYEVDADQVEIGDQIIIHGDPIEVTGIDESPVDIETILITGYSHESGDSVTYFVKFDYSFDVWGI